MNIERNITSIEEYPFSKEGITKIKEQCNKAQDWPVVYILHNNKEAYVGETQNAYNRMNQHIVNKKRQKLEKISLMINDMFNKSAVLDIENKLITHMMADGKYTLQNENSGQSKLHNYYQRYIYEEIFDDLWKNLKVHNLANHSLYEIQNMDIFKFSPYKQLTQEQYNVVENLLNDYVDAMMGETKKYVVVHGGAGTGKSLIAIYFINLLINILNNNIDTSDDEEIDEDSLFNKAKTIKEIKEFGSLKIGFVIPVPSFRGTVKKIFKSIKELKNVDVISPSAASKGDYDLLIVDEAHRLKRRKKLTNYGTHDNVNRYLNLPLDSTELDWVNLKSNKLLILFYDEFQSVKESDVRKEDFDKIIQNKNCIQYHLTSQLRVKGGNEYINFVHKLFSDKPINFNKNVEYDLKVYDNCKEMFEAIKEKNIEKHGLCRMLSGLSFKRRMKVRDNKSVSYTRDYDFEIDGQKFNWNDDFNAEDFISNEKNINNVGCIYTSQGHDLNYAGVIFGEDIFYNTDTQKIDLDVNKFIDTNSISSEDKETIKNIINAYIVLLTRGIYGTYIYAVDKNLRDYLKTLIN